MVSYATSFADRTPSSTSTVVESNDSTAKRQASPSTASDSPSRVICVRRGLESQGISKDACVVILQSWTTGTINQKQYNKPWREWKVTDYLRTLVPLEFLSFKDLCKKASVELKIRLKVNLPCRITVIPRVHAEQL